MALGNMKLYHGTTQAFVAHVGLCLTTDRGVAMAYSRRSSVRGVVYEVDLELGGLSVGVVEVGFDESGAPGDTREECDEYAADGFDVVRFDDEDYEGEKHTTWRLVSQRAIDAVTVLS